MSVKSEGELGNKEVTIPVISEDILSKWGMSPEEFKSKFAEQWNSMQLVKIGNADQTIPDKAWCITIHFYRDRLCLYLTKIDESYVFSQFTDNVDFWTKEECEKLVDVVKQMRNGRVSGASNTVVQAYNPYTGELI